MAFTIPEEERQSFLQWYKNNQSTGGTSGGGIPRTIVRPNYTGSLGDYDLPGNYTRPNGYDRSGSYEDMMSRLGNKASGWYQKWKKSKDTETPVASKAFVANTRVAAPVVAVQTSSPAYAKGGMVRGCGKAVKGRGKVKVY